MNIAGTLDQALPLHTALKSSSARCVKEIIQMYPKQLHAKVSQDHHPVLILRLISSNIDQAEALSFLDL